MSEPITSDISDRICAHMNDDHADAVLLYAQTFGNFPDAETARMVSIDPQGMDLSAKANGTAIPVRVAFERELKDAADAHHTLIEMLKQARQART